KKEVGAFIVVSPQNPAPDRNKPGFRGWDPKAVKGLLDEVIANHKQADPDRVYLTGLSLGGFGTWSTAAAYPDTFAAIAPICGGGAPSQTDQLQNITILVLPRA